MKLVLRSRFGQITWLKTLYNHGLLKKPWLNYNYTITVWTKNRDWIHYTITLWTYMPRGIISTTSQLFSQHAFAKNWTSNLPILILTLQPLGYPSLHVTFSKKNVYVLSFHLFPFILQQICNIFYIKYILHYIIIYYITLNYSILIYRNYTVDDVNLVAVD